MPVELRTVTFAAPSAWIEIAARANERILDDDRIRSLNRDCGRGRILALPVAGVCAAVGDDDRTGISRRLGGRRGILRGRELRDVGETDFTFAADTRESKHSVGDIHLDRAAGPAQARRSLPIDRPRAFDIDMDARRAGRGIAGDQVDGVNAIGNRHLPRIIRDGANEGIVAQVRQAPEFRWPPVAGVAQP